MKILVISDVHSYQLPLETALADNMNCETAIFLGDGISSFLDARDPAAYRARIIVRGNCDHLGNEYDESAVVNLDGLRLYITHGHREGVKTGFGVTESKAVAGKCRAALFGHTHSPHLVTTGNGIVLMNPGSIADGYYGIIETSANEAVFTLKNTEFPKLVIKEMRTEKGDEDV